MFTTGLANYVLTVVTYDRRCAKDTSKVTDYAQNPRERAHILSINKENVPELGGGGWGACQNARKFLELRGIF